MSRIELRKSETNGYLNFDYLTNQVIIRTEWDWFGDGYKDAYEILKNARFFNALPCTGLDVVVFPSLAWELTKGFNRYGCVVFGTERAVNFIGRDIDFLTKWEYEYGTGEEWTGYAIGQEGYTRSRGKKSGLFSLAIIDDLIALQAPSLSDQTAEINLYAIQQGEIDKLAILLSRNAPAPTMSEVLSVCDIFINFVYSLDVGYSDAITIKSRKDISAHVLYTVDALEKRIERFEKEISACQSVSSYLRILERLVCGE